MKFVGLVSGGKDSLFNILHCIENGHELACLANLHPPEGVADEMDSFMYQTVGYHALSMYGECLGVPLYRGAIEGSSKAIGLEYEETEKDETEDLFRLLKDVKEAQPEVEGVSVGAILSNYQRTRVEDVCNRLGLTSLAFLWQRRQDELLDEIIGSGVDARIIKTAAVGLGRPHLGRSLGDVRADLIKYHEMYGIHLCGEGGEYETLVVDAPVFKKRLHLDMENSVVKDFSSEFVAYLERIKVQLHDKDAGPEENQSSVPVPPLLSDRFQETYEDCPDADYPTDTATVSLAEEPVVIDCRPTSYRTEQETVVFNNLQSPTPADVATETRHVFEELGRELQTYDLDYGSLASITLLLKDMADFETVNQVYQTRFSKALPPARLCIATRRIPRKVQLSAVASEEARIGLHVQGRSYWAPSNIGPYSQAIFTNDVYYFSGQIGLIPASLQLHPSLKTQSILALQNLVNVAVAQNARINVVMCFITNTSLYKPVQQIWASVTQALDPVDTLVAARNSLIVAVVDNLPKNAAVEWAALGSTSTSQANFSVTSTLPQSQTQAIVFTTTPTSTPGHVIPVNALYDVSSRQTSLAAVVV
jgi:diphthine-ammonia ligase